MVFKINNNWCVDIEERPSVSDSILSKAKLIFYHENKTNGVALNMVIERYGETKQDWHRVKIMTDELFNGLSDDERKVFIDKVLNIENNRIKVKPDEDKIDDVKKPYVLADKSKAKLIFYHENKTNDVVAKMVKGRYGENKQDWHKIKIITDELFNGLSAEEQKTFVVSKAHSELHDKVAVEEPCFTIEELSRMDRIALSPGDTVRVRSSTNACVYVVTMPKMGNTVYCSCPAWKFQKKPASARTCKHCIAVAGCCRYIYVFY